MPTKHLGTLLLLLVFAVLAGCNVMDRQPPPDVAETPPYLQPRSELTHSHMAEMRAFHEADSAQNLENIRVARNREMARLEAVGKELERDHHRQEDNEKIQGRRVSWTSWFKKTEKDNTKAGTSVLNSRLGTANQNVR